MLFIFFDVIFSDEEPHTLASIMSQKSQLSDLIEPDFGLLDELLRLEVLTPREYDTVCSKSTAADRTEAILDLLTSADQCDKFMKTLQQTGQQRLANFISGKGGQRECSYNSSLLQSAVAQLQLSLVSK